MDEQRVCNRWLRARLRGVNHPAREDFYALNALLNDHDWQIEAAQQLIDFARSHDWTESKFLAAINLIHSHEMTAQQLRIEQAEDNGLTLLRSHQMVSRSTAFQENASLNPEHLRSVNNGGLQSGMSEHTQVVPGVPLSESIVDT